MTGSNTDAGSAAQYDELTVTDPDALADRPGVDVEETTYEHDDAEHCESGAAGRAIVGVTNDAGEVLVQRHESEQVVLLPNGIVDPGEDFAAVAREMVADALGVEICVDGVEALRRVEHVVDGEPTTGTAHVIFAASPEVDSGDPEHSREEWEVEWLSSIPASVANQSMATVADVERFI